MSPVRSRIAALDAPPFEIVKAPPPRFGRATDAIEGMAIIGYEASRAVLAEPIEEVWQGVFGPRHHIEMCGPSYSGKSGLAVGIAVAMANPTGKPRKLLGREVTPFSEGKLALIVNEENAKQSAVATVDRWIEMLRLPESETWNRIALVPRRGVRAHPLSDADVRNPPLDDRWAALVHALAAGRFGVAVFDTRARIFSAFGNPDKEDTQAAVSNVLTEIIERAECPVIVVSHTRKGAEGNEIEDVSGSAQRGGGADVVLMVTATRKDGRVLASKLAFLKVRDGLGEHPAPIRFTVSRPDGKHWTLTMHDVEEERSASAEDRVYKVLSDADAEMSANEIRKALAFNHATAKTAIDALRRAKRIKARETKRNGAACWVYKANPTFEEVFAAMGANDA